MRKHNNARVVKAKDENEIWKIVNEINKPKSGDGITLMENNIKIVDEGKVAELFITIQIRYNVGLVLCLFIKNVLVH